MEIEQHAPEQPMGQRGNQKEYQKEINTIQMERSKIDRINFLARKSKNEELTPEEKAEQKMLRDEYRAEFKRSLMVQLDNVYVVDENGKEKKLIKELTHILILMTKMHLQKPFKKNIKTLQQVRKQMTNTALQVV